MKHLHKILLSLLVGLPAAGVSPVQAGNVTADTTVVFNFRPGKNSFMQRGNEASLDRLYSLLDAYGPEVASGAIRVYVDGYCASLPTVKGNLTTAYIRANRVKSELIVHKGLKESDFTTANYAEPYGDRKDAVVVTLRFPVEAPAAPQPQRPEPVEASPAPVEPEPEPEIQTPPPPQPQPEPVAPQPLSEPAKPYCFAVRTNVLYDAFLLPTLGVEWRINRSVGIKLDGSLSWWGGPEGKVQKMWMLSPEARWYLLRDKRFYAGVSANFGQANIYKYALGGLLSKDTGYQGSFWGVGLTVGYQLYVSRSFSFDFNLGLGYTRFEYDSFGLIDGVRVYKGRDQSKNFWGPTQAGIGLVWTIGGNKQK